MRVISQDGAIDIPYEKFVFGIVDGEIRIARDLVFTRDEEHLRIIAKYSSQKKALKVMELLREVYTGMPIIMQNCDVSEDIVKEFEKLNKCGLMVRAEEEPPKIEYINNAVFQFPADDEVKV